MAGTYTGPDEIFGLWKRIAEQTGRGLVLTVIDVLANDDRAVVLLLVRGERGSHRLEQRQVATFDLRDSRVTEARFVYEKPAEYDAFWSD